jgi:uncharacterized protein YcbX
LLGDRAFAVTDAADGKIASAKNPRKWLRLFEFRAAFVEPPRAGQELPPVRITLPDGEMITSAQSDVDDVLSKALGRRVMLQMAAPEQPVLEEYWPDMEGLDRRDTVTEEPMPPGTFFDCASVHLLTTATLDQLRKSFPEGRFEVRRFRPNIVIRPARDESGYVENAWIGRTAAVGGQVRLKITGPCPRCVMTTLPQSDLPADPGILRAAARENQARVGVYAAVTQGGAVRRGDAVWLEE